MIVDNELQMLKMVELTEDDGIIIDLKYATKDNFTKQIIYKNTRCLLKEKTANKLLKANDILRKENIKIKVWDAFRSLRAQKKFWDIYPDERFVSNPNTNKSNHCKGIAVDVTLCDNNGIELKMPTEFDHFGEESYVENIKNLDEETKVNILLLQNAMLAVGFKIFETEWWHFNDSEDDESLILEELN